MNVPKKWLVVIIIIFMIVLTAILLSKPKEEIDYQIDGLHDLDDLEQLDEINELEEEPEKSIWMVDLKGEVVQPGVYEIEQGKRVVDVIELAGGFLDSADLHAVNLAEHVYDEMVIFVPDLQNENTQNSGEYLLSDSKVRVNQASLSDLMQLPGIGEQKARDIIDYREAQGPFSRPEDLLDVSGIGEKTLEKFLEQIIVP
ncbi:helix-hairpin-helix domain-containing protein [Alkalibacillus aidingensis]|uniref:helix-hairpin-helix domain-containing protein n=1 Tax=Alkalibacillus aidingensis TaxID=2747607 RepID=UPI00166134E8|nr:helix-hairpin-helix domain-containing protein [Alkalibacillus aidingensis]